VNASKQLRLWSAPVHFQSELSAMLRTVSESSDAHWHLSFAAVTDAKQPAHFQMLAVRPRTLGHKFKSLVMEQLQSIVDRIEDGALEVHEYSGATTLDDNELEHVSIDRNERVLSQFAPLNAPLDMPKFRDAAEFKEGLRFYVISLWPKDELPIHCFRLYSDAYELNKRWFMIQRGAEYFDTFEQTGFLFDEKVDCISQGNDLFILRMDSFHRIFQFYEYVARDALQIASDIDASIGFGNIEQLNEACYRDHVFAMKLAGLAGQSHLKKLTISHLKRMIARHGLHIRVTVSKGREVLEYSSKYRWEFFHLLADDYLHSRMTAQDYRSSSKRLATVVSVPQAGSRKSRPNLQSLPDVAEIDGEGASSQLKSVRTRAPNRRN
jgi:hypothetical protein